jgi:UDP-N-acetylmuramoylalanine--D-glutamate ligase
VSVHSFGLEPGASLSGATVVVCGFARTGQAVAELLTQLKAKVRILEASQDADKQGIAEKLGAQFISGREQASDLEGADLVVASPGITPKHVWWSAARTNNIPWWSEIELAWRAGMKPLAAVTGTNGKTTTVEMLTSVLVQSGIPATAAGNIGTPLASLRPGDPIVAEVSSFQLAASSEFCAPVAAWLNFAPDHLDWHSDLQDYAAAKASLFARQSAQDVCVAHPSVLDRIQTSASVTTFDIAGADAQIQEGWLTVRQERIIETSQLRRPHRTFILDALAAAACARTLGTDATAIATALASFEPAPHRLEPVATIDEVDFVNDSKATDPHATEAALASFETPIVLIAGGLNKGLSLQGLAATGANVRAVVTIGEASAAVAEAFRSADVEVVEAGDLEKAVTTAFEKAKPGDTVLLSPACASYDQFRNYEHRGDVFKQAVKNLERRQS